MPKQVLLGAVAIALVFCLAVATRQQTGMFGPTTYDECILDSMKGVSSDVAAKIIIDSCEQKFVTKPLTTEIAWEAEHTRPLRGLELQLVETGQARLSNKSSLFGGKNRTNADGFDTFEFVIGNELSDLTITEITISVQESETADAVQYSTACRIKARERALLSVDVPNLHDVSSWQVVHVMGAKPKPKSWW